MAFLPVSEISDILSTIVFVMVTSGLSEEQLAFSNFKALVRLSDFLVEAFPSCGVRMLLGTRGSLL